MCYKFTVLAFACISGLAAQNTHYRTDDSEDPGYREPRGVVQDGSKFFQDIYVAMEKPNEIEFGHVSETPREWEQRFERIDLENLQRQGKVRWGDKDGGYGEHYYDFNHDKPSAEQQSEPVAYEPQQLRQQPAQYNAYVPQPQYPYVPQQAAPQPPYNPYTPQETRRAPQYARLPATPRAKREQGLLKDVEFINDKAKSLILDGRAQKHGGNYRAAYDYDRGKREEQKEEEDEDDYDY